MLPRVALPLLALALSASPGLAQELRVMSYNIWGGGANEEKSIDETLAVLRAAEPRHRRHPGDPDRRRGLHRRLLPAGRHLGRGRAGRGAWAITTTTRRPRTWRSGRTRSSAAIPSARRRRTTSARRSRSTGRTVWAFNIHLDDEPYQPYQLLGIEYGPAPFIDTAEDAIRFAEETRGPAIELLISDMAATAEGDITFVFGDFNEPSGLDWTEAAAAAGTASHRGRLADHARARGTSASSTPTAPSTPTRWPSPPSPGRRGATRSRPRGSPRPDRLRPRPRRRHRDRGRHRGRDGPAQRPCRRSLAVRPPRRPGRHHRQLTARPLSCPACPHRSDGSATRSPAMTPTPVFDANAAGGKILRRPARMGPHRPLLRARRARVRARHGLARERLRRLRRATTRASWPRSTRPACSTASRATRRSTPWRAA